MPLEFQRANQLAIVLFVYFAIIFSPADSRNERKLPGLDYSTS